MIKIIGRKGCTSCLMAKKTLVKNKVEFEYIDLDFISEDDKSKYIDKARECGKASLPFILIGDNFVDLKEVIDNAR